MFESGTGTGMLASQERSIGRRDSRGERLDAGGRTRATSDFDSMVHMTALMLAYVVEAICGSRLEDSGHIANEDGGWKFIHGDQRNEAAIWANDVELCLEG